MAEYIFTRLIALMFYAISAIQIYSFIFDTNIHFTKYHDVDIVSEKIDTIRDINGGVLGIQRCVVWRGTDSHGVRELHKTEDMSKSDYNRIKTEHKIKFVNCTGIIIWIALILFSLLFACFVLNEDLTFDYDYDDTIAINNMLLKIIPIILIFCGYDKNMVMKFFNEKIQNDGCGARVFSLHELFSEFYSYRKSLG